MQEYVPSGLRLGWLILPASKQVEVHTASDVRVLDSPDTLSGDPVLPAFTLELTLIWNPPF
jgi:Uma2 family endonuclease